MLKEINSFGEDLFELENFDTWDINNRSKYGGRSCNKVGLIDNNGDKWMLKISDNLKIKIPNTDLSYSNSPITEFIASKIYKELNFDTHEVKLGFYKNKLAVACKDFTGPDKDLIELGLYKINNDNGVELFSITSNFNINLKEQLNYLERFSIDTINRFWSMFIIDAFLGNGDRTDSNWGFLATDTSIGLAPIYDNGASLCPNWSEDKMRKFIDGDRVPFVHSVRTCCFLNDKGIQMNPFKYIKSGVNPICTSTFKVLLPKINKLDYKSIINSVTILSDVQREFYCELLRERVKWFNELKL